MKNKQCRGTGRQRVNARSGQAAVSSKAKAYCLALLLVTVSVQAGVADTGSLRKDLDSETS